jgi:DNA-directed RNA polymerase
MNPEYEFERLSESFAPLIKKTIRYLGLQHNYEEAYQRGLIALWEASRDFDPEKGYFPSYAKAKITGRLKSLMTKGFLERERLTSLSDSEAGIEASVPPSEIFSFDLENCQLSGKEQLWIKEFIFEGLNTEEMAKRHEVSAHTVRSWKKGVKRKLEAYFINKPL